MLIDHGLEIALTPSMVAFLIATLISSVSLANAPASIPSTKIIAEKIAENDVILNSIDHDQVAPVKHWLNQGHSPFAIVQNKMRESILDRAASLGSEKVFELLLAEMETKIISAEHSWRDGRGTPILLGLISLATTSNLNVHKYERMIERFLSKHSDQINFQDKAYIGDGRTALHQAAANGNLVVLKALLSHGAHINSLNSTGETPLHFAARFGQLAVLKTLIRSGANLNVKSKFTLVTPLLAAAENGHEVIIRELLDAGAKKDEKDVFGKSAPDRYRDYVSNYYHLISNKN